MGAIHHLPRLRSQRFNPRVPLAGILWPEDPTDPTAAPPTTTDSPDDSAYTPVPDDSADSAAPGNENSTVKIYGVHHITFPRGVENWENIDQYAYALVPAIGATVTILSYVVPPGRNAVIYKIADNFVGGGWVEGTGDIVWRVLVDGTPPPGATSYDSILGSLGNPASPTEIPGFRVFENQVLSLVAFNNPAGPDGGVIVAGQRVGGRLVGWNYPVDVEEQNIWI
jgi:hypothetical protein